MLFSSCRSDLCSRRVVPANSRRKTESNSFEHSPRYIEKYDLAVLHPNRKKKTQIVASRNKNARAFCCDFYYVLVMSRITILKLSKYRLLSVTFAKNFRLRLKLAARILFGASIFSYAELRLMLFMFSAQPYHYYRL